VEHRMVMKSIAFNGRALVTAIALPEPCKAG
jgi:hypothetical protein